MKNLFIGIDVSKEKIDCCVKNRSEVLKELVVANEEKSIVRMLKAALKEANATVADTLVCAVYTGMYIFPLVCACKKLGVFLWIEDPTQIKYSFGVKRGKNDRADAFRIAEYALRFCDKAKPYALKSEDYASLRILMTDRELLLSDRKKYEAQLNDQKRFMSDADYKRKTKRLQPVINSLAASLTEIEKQIEAIVKSNQKIEHQVELLCSVDGVGYVAAIRMVTITDGFEKFSNCRQFCCYAGIAPFQYISGSSVHSKCRVSQRANKSVKALLHMCSIAVIHRKNGEMKDYYLRKTAEGKHPMLVLNAIRSKIVARMFAVVKNDKPYQRNFFPPDKNILDFVC